MGRRRRIDIRYQPPWRDRRPDGSLSQEYGPTPASYARALRRHQDWAWRTEPQDPRRDAAEVVAFMRGLDGELRADVPPSERDAYLAVYEDGMSIREVARRTGKSRETVRSYLRRLQARVKVKACR